jgi:hypothetical protein
MATMGSLVTGPVCADVPIQKIPCQRSLSNFQADSPPEADLTHLPELALIEPKSECGSDGQ